ncbi:MAG: carboxylating nicotinate-nucleotide diphosphorylase [Candidatus Aminicenantes bacterium]|nr:carboxylating nicotinate-nucleotide diphosphorylase [Candidatus Aminicenantes bacterium]
MDFKDKLMLQIIELALSEDKISADITTNSLIEYDNQVSAYAAAKEAGVISGIPVFIETFKKVDPATQIQILKNDGDEVKKGDIVLEILGKESSILKAERTALNFLQRLSGISTLTKKYVDKLKPYNITLLDTRKTTPGMRYLEKKAVRDGGGSNHRLNLEEMAMVKDNHIRMAGTISKAVKKIREKFPQKKLEVEVKDLSELNEALSLQVDLIMLDNFDPGLLKEAVKIKKKSPGHVKFEISGNVTLENIEEKAIPGIDFISVGALTHSVKSLDLSLEIRGENERIL